MKPLTFDEKDLKKLFKSDTPSSRFLRKLSRALMSALILSLIFLLFFGLFNFHAFAKRFTFTISPPEPIVNPIVTTPNPAPVVVEPIFFQPEIEIRKLGLVAPIIMTVPFDQMTEQLRNGVAHYQGTALPGEIGNSVIVGHSSDFIWSEGQFKAIFALLDKLEIGDEIIVRYQTNEHRYRVTGSQVVRPTELSVLKRTPNPQLTLITCYPVGTTRSRLIIHSELVSETVTGYQQTDPAIIETLPRSR